MRPWIPLGHPDRNRPTCKSFRLIRTDLFFPLLNGQNLIYLFLKRHLYGHVLQRPVRQVRHQANVRLLSKLGAQVGISTQEHPRRDPTLFGRHHQPSGLDPLDIFL